MKVTVDGNDLRVKRTTRGMVELQQQTGWDLSQLDHYTKQGYGEAIAVFWALTNAGFHPNFDEICDRDLEDFTFTPEPGDDKTAATPEADAVDPQTSPAGSDPGGAAPPEPAPVEAPPSVA